MEIELEPGPSVRAAESGDCLSGFGREFRYWNDVSSPEK